MPTVPRRVVTGHTPDGVSVVLSDGPVPVSRELPDDGVAFHEVWNTTGAPGPPGRGRGRWTRPSASWPSRRRRSAPRSGSTSSRPATSTSAGCSRPCTAPPRWTTASCSRAQITLVLDDSEVTLHAGDIVVQRGTDHAWANRGDTVARVCFVLVDGEFTPELSATLPDGALDRLSRKGPRD